MFHKALLKQGHLQNAISTPHQTENKSDLRNRWEECQAVWKDLSDLKRNSSALGGKRYLTGLPMLIHFFWLLNCKIHYYKNHIKNETEGK